MKIDSFFEEKVLKFWMERYMEGDLEFEFLVKYDCNVFGLNYKYGFFNIFFNLYN